jgi:hypothetical protein
MSSLIDRWLEFRFWRMDRHQRGVYTQQYFIKKYPKLDGKLRVLGFIQGIDGVVFEFTNGTTFSVEEPRCPLTDKGLLRWFAEIYEAKS